MPPMVSTLPPARVSMAISIALCTLAPLLRRSSPLPGPPPPLSPPPPPLLLRLWADSLGVNSAVRSDDPATTTASYTRWWRECRSARVMSRAISTDKLSAEENAKDVRRLSSLLKDARRLTFAPSIGAPIFGLGTRSLMGDTEDLLDDTEDL
eukprot:CAMPEP_0198705264 /NCGR_PEP_ID=MMETSP1468-20131203/390341_1 /TAXON_ID=1461545 /ORGANISM="Mantoniella sp, Strain CCMP1436" /LENGTH=151 /DNA_ID=CAMNT_0044464129 /DNA_START=3327 /DNA_END=3779 /DNA_ORIENTATION=-